MSWEALRVGNSQCRGGHDFAATSLGAGMVRHECRRCEAAVVDLDAAEDGRSVTAPGLFGPARPTIFSVLAEERRKMETAQEEARSTTGGPAFAFGGSARRR